MEYRLRSANGEYRWVLDTGVPRLAPGGALLGYIGTAIEITERKRAEERVRQIVELSPSAILMMDADGVIKLVNAQARSVFGYPGDELVGQTIEMLVPDLDVAVESRGHSQCTSPLLPTRAPSAGHELIGRRKDGSEVPIEASLSPIETSEGTFILASIIDFTERRAAEREQMLQRNELFHLSRVAVLGELLGSLSHELHQPLTAILTNAQAAQEILATTPMDEDEFEAILEDIVSADKRAAEVISRLRLLFRKGEVQYEALDLNEVVLDVLKLMDGDLAYHNVTLHTELASDLPKIKGDRVQLQQVFINLIVNATDAMDEITTTDRELLVRTRLDDHGCVELRITDTGCGIPIGQIERVFQPFHTTKAKGTGLGLAVCRTIISAHSGTLWAANNPERGATFHVALSPEPAGAL
jgi:PAS domain S-box-containing protein